MHIPSYLSYKHARNVISKVKPPTVRDGMISEICVCRTDTGTVIDLSEANGVSSQELSPLLDASEQILKQIWAKIVNPTENELTGEKIYIH